MNQIPKEIGYLTLPVQNSGNDDAFEPELRLTARSKTKEILAIYPLTKRASLLAFKVLDTLTDLPSDAQLAGIFLRDGLTQMGKVDAHMSHKFVIGFAFKGENTFYVASEDILDPIRLDIGREWHGFGMSAKAKNSSEYVLAKHVVLSLRGWNDMDIQFLESDSEPTEETPSS